MQNSLCGMAAVDLYHGIENAKQEGGFRLCGYGIN